MESITVDIVTLTSSDSKFLESLSEIVKQKGGTEGVFLGKKVEADGIFEIFVGIVSHDYFLGLRHLLNFFLTR